MKIKSKRTLTKFISKSLLTVISVYLLGGDKKAVDTEDIAMKCNELAPGQFTWKKYSHQINLELVRTYLSDAKKSRNGHLLSGSGRDGWRLSPQGLEWISAREKHFLSESNIQLNTNLSSAGSIDTVRKEREKTRLKSSTAWKIWREEKRLSIDEVKKIFRIDEYATDKMLENKVVRLRSLLKGDKEVGPFVREATDAILRGRK